MFKQNHVRTSGCKWLVRNVPLLVWCVCHHLPLGMVEARAEIPEAHITQTPSVPPKVQLTTTSIEHLESFCIDCHGADPDDIAGGLDLAAMLEEKSIPTPEIAATILDAMESKRMPPLDAASPEDSERMASVREIETALKQVIHSLAPVEARTIRRMNRFQFNNAVMDLFELNCIVFTLPERIMREHGRYFNPSTKAMPDQVTVGNRPLGKSQMIEPRLAGVAAFPQDLRAEHGYDNQTDHLSMSPLLMEEFLRLGTSITQSPDFNPKRVGIWQTFFAEPKDGRPLTKVVRERLKPFIRHAFRGHTSEQTLDRYTDYAMKRIAEGKAFTVAMRDVAAAIIASPRFYYLYNAVTPSKAATPSESPDASDALDLATRLSLFLWGSIPDNELLAAAESGNLLDNKVLESQVDRMLADRKLKRFCDSFPSQWLQLERLISSIPNRDQYPEFYFSKYRRSMHMMLEPLLLFETVLIENRSILELIDPDFSYRTSLLENAYGDLKSASKAVPGPGGQVTTLNFHRVPIQDRRSGGIITNAAVMTMTSGPNRTQPITRGAWIAGVIFNSPPKPPPADVPPLNEDAELQNDALTLREQLKIHRERSDCRGCHEQIDPLGFALENYDAIGRWREQYPNGSSIPTSGTIYGDRSFQNITEFKDAVLQEKDRYARALTEHMAAFALARQIEVRDRFEIDRISRRVAESEYAIQSLIREIILSKLFLNG